MKACCDTDDRDAERIGSIKIGSRKYSKAVFVVSRDRSLLFVAHVAFGSLLICVQPARQQRGRLRLCGAHGPSVCLETGSLRLAHQKLGIYSPALLHVDTQVPENDRFLSS